MKITHNGNVLSIYDNIEAGWEQWYLLVSDVHHDSILCNREFELYHLNEALTRNARVLYFGDTLDGMQGRFDPRRSYSELRPEYCKDNYYDLIVNDLAKFLTPYAKNILMLGRGNHENAILKNVNIDVLNLVAHELNISQGTSIKVGGFGGWIRFMFVQNDESPAESIKLKYFHGSGGEAPVTKGAIQTNRQAVYLPDAQIVVNGHSHNQYHISISRERLSNKGQIYFDLQHHIRIPGYKQDYADGSGGWAVERGMCPKPIGAIWLHFHYKNGQIHTQIIPDIRGGEVVAPIPYSVEPKQEYAQDSEYP